MSATYNPGGIKPPLVDQPTAAPTRKVTAAGTVGSIGGAIALLVVESMQQVPSLAFLSEGGWQAVSYIIAAGVAGGSAFLGGYFTRNRA